MNEFEPEFEDALRAALRRPEPPDGFAERVVARTVTRTGGRARPRGWNWIAASVAACALVTAGGFGYRQYEGRKASRQLAMALDIAGGKLNIARRKVSELNRRTIHE